MSAPFVISIIGIPQSGKSTLTQSLASSFNLEKEKVLLTTPQDFDSDVIPSIAPVIPNVSEGHYSHIFVDCPSEITPEVKKILQQSCCILIPTECDESKLTTTRKLLESLYGLVPKDLIYVVLNHYSPQAKIDPLFIKKQLGTNILGALPQDPLFLTTPKTIITSHSKSLAAQYILQLNKIIQTKKILEKGNVIQKMHYQAEEKVIPLKATGTESVVTFAHQKLYSRFAQEIPPQNTRTLLKIKILKQLTSELDLKKLDTETGNDPKKMALLRSKTKNAVVSIMEKEKISVGNKNDTEFFIKEILDEALALGPLETLLADPAVTEIMVNGKDQIYIEKNGKIILSSLTFTSNSQLLGIIERIVAPLGRRIDEKTPYCDARLADGSRVHAIIPPLAIQGPMLTIRKFAKTPYTTTDLIRFGSLTEDMVDFLRAAIEVRQNCIVSGGTGTGKTTLLNVLSSFIPENERIITVEDSAELQLSQPHVGRLESRPPNIEGTGAITIRDLVRNTLRMRPDRIIVGECRDGAALDMLQAMNTGHDGSLTTIHANSPRDCLSRLETLVMMAGMDLPSRAIREQAASALNLIIQIARFSDGTRKIVNISEVTGMEKEVITLQDIVSFKQKGMDASGKIIGQFEFTGFIPKFIFDLEKKGIRVPKAFSFKRKPDPKLGGQ